MIPSSTPFTTRLIRRSLVLFVLGLSFFTGIAQQPGKKNLSGNNPENNSPKMIADEVDQPSVIYLNAVHIDAKNPAIQSARKTVNAFAGKQMHLIKFKSAIQPDWYKLMITAGVEIVDYIPNYAYLVFGDYASIKNLQTQANKLQSPIEWDGAYLPEYRISPNVYLKNEKGVIGKNAVASNRFSVQLFANDATNTQTRNLMRAIKITGTTMNEQRISHYVNIVVSLTPDGLRQISERSDVISIHPYIEPRRNDESQNMIMTGPLTGNGPTPGNYLTYLASKGFTQAQFDASNFVVNVSDDGLDNGVTGTTMNTISHFALYKSGDPAQASRVAFIHKQGTATDNDSRGCAGHGTLNTHIVGGYVPDALLGNANHTDANGFRYGLGVAPFVKVGNSTVFTTAGAFTNPNYANLESESYRDGGRISTNSWGAPVNGAYNTDAQAYDFLVRDAQPSTASVPNAGNQQMVIFFSAGNSGSGAGTIGSPGTGKNVITVGASEGVRAFGGADGCGITDAQANSANDIIGFSSRGPTTDGRKKPDIVAPGTHITGGVYQSSIANPITGTGTANACFTASGVCGGVGTANFFPGTQQWTSASSGTSHSTPALAGFGALIRQNFINKSLTAPSPAMTKAMILTSAAYMNGAGANDNLYSNNQGMGRVDMTTCFGILDNPNILRDQQAADMFTASGQSFVRSGVVANTGAPVRVTVAYTDAPGPTSGNAFVNNLDLEVTVGGITYLGNVFTGGLSSSGGTADTRNNVESVFLPAGTSGNILIKIKATNIAGDGVPNVGTALDQDFALVVTNVTEVATPVLGSTTPTITAESCAPANAAIDPGETVTVNFCVQNVGTLNTTNLVGTLLATGGVTTPSAAQNYGALTAGGAAVCKTFTFNNSGTCGGTITLSFQFQDGATDLGVQTYVFTVGGTVTSAPTTFSNTAAITIPATGTGAATGAPATPYPSNITVSGLTGTISKLTLSLTGLNHTFPSDVDMLLVGPAGQKFVFLSDVIGGTDWTNINYTFDDAAGGLVPSAGTPVGGTFQPTNYGSGDLFPAPAPAGPYSDAASAGTATFGNVFNGTNPNGVWSLYIVDDAGTDAGTLTGGWSLTVTTAVPSCCTGAPPTGPTVTINQAVGQADPTAVSPINYTVVFSESVTGFDGSDVILTGTAGATTALVTGSGATYNVAVSGMTTTGTVIANIPAGAAVNGTAQASVASTSTDNQVTFGTVPTVTINQAAGQADPTPTGPINFTVVFSEAVTGFTSSDISFTGSTAPGTLVATITGTGPTYNVAVSGMTGAGLVITSIPPNIALSLVGIPNAASTSTDNTVTYTPPVCTLTCPADITVNTTLNQCGANVTLPPPTTVGTCGTVTYSQASGSFFPKGTTIVTATSSNGPTCTFRVIVVDNQAPSITCPATVTVSCASAVPAANPAGVTATDNCPGVVVTHVGDVISAQTCANKYTITRTYRATDAAGLITNCTQTIIVNDITAPVISCPADITTPSTVGACNKVVTFAPTATDNCTGAVTVTTSPVSGSTFPIGTTTVTVTATDVCGNVSTCSFKVIVTDAQLPVISVQPANRTVCTGTAAVFSVTATNANSYQWQQYVAGAWSDIAGASGSTLTVNGATIAMNTNSYRVNVIGLCTTVTSNFAALYVNTLPAISLSTTNPPVLLPTQTTSIVATVNPTGGTFAWFKNGAPRVPTVTGASLVDLKVDDAGVYRAVYTDPNGCVNTSADIVISAEMSSQLFIAPNPNFGQFWVRYYNQANEQVTLRVFGANGALVYKQSLTTLLPYTRIDVDLLNNAPGIYLVELRGAGGKLLGSKQIIVGHR